MSSPVVLGWSGGKDSALALDALQRHDAYEVVALFTTFTRGYERVSMHGVRRELIQLQAERLGIPLVESWIEQGADNNAYEAATLESLAQFREQGIEQIAFGDLFLEEIKEYRDRLIERAGMQTLYPIWGRPTDLLAWKFISDGFKAVTCCVDSKQIPPTFCGRQLDFTFLQTLPDSADPCGENGEFHTFVYDCPLMSHPIDVELGESRQDGQFHFTDLLPVSEKQMVTTGENS